MELHQPDRPQIDRRVARTREALFESLVRLMRRKHYEAISVQDILEEANVGRSTFYAHFASKDDLLERSLDRSRAILRAALREQPARRRPGTLAFSRAMFEHVDEYRWVYYSLTGKHAGTIVLNSLQRIFADFVRDDIGARRNEDMPKELVVQFVAGAFMTTLRWWLEKKPSLPPAKADELFRRLALRGVGAI